MTGTVTELNGIYDAKGTGNNKINGLGAETLTVEDTSIAATALTHLDSDTTGLVGLASTNTTITGDLTECTAVIDAAIGDPTADPVVPPTISAEALTKTYDISTALNLSQVNVLDGKLATGGVIDAALTVTAAHKDIPDL